MAGGVRKLGVGDQVKIAAKDYNRWQDAGMAHAFARFNQADGLLVPDAQEGIILVKNTTALSLPRFSILGLNGSVYDPNYSEQQRSEFKNQIALKGEMPSSTYAGKFCVLQNDALPGEVVPAMVSGVTLCWVKLSSTGNTHGDVETDTAIADRTRYLKGGSSGAHILFKPSGLTGEQLCVVRISNPSSPQVALADFRSHVSPATPYDYPEPSDETEDLIFPAYIQRDMTFIDDPSDPSWDVDATLTYPPGAPNSNAEPVFVYSLRRTYIPPTPSGVIGQRLKPIFLINGKWYCDYIPHFRICTNLTTSSISVADSTVENLTRNTVSYNDNDDSTGTYSPITVASNGIISIHRTMRCRIDVTAQFFHYGFTGANLTNEGFIRWQSVTGTPDVLTDMPDATYTFAPLPAGKSYEGGNVTSHSSAVFEFEEGDEIRFRISTGAGGSVSLISCNVLMTPSFGL